MERLIEEKTMNQNLYFMKHGLEHCKAIPELRTLCLSLIKTQATHIDLDTREFLRDGCVLIDLDWIQCDKQRNIAEVHNLCQSSGRIFRRGSPFQIWKCGAWHDINWIPFDPQNIFNKYREREYYMTSRKFRYND